MNIKKTFNSKTGFYMPRIEVINDRNEVFKEKSAEYPFIFGPPNL